VLRGNKETGISGGTLYFFVPKGTRRFLVKTNVIGGLTLQPHEGEGKPLAFNRKKAANESTFDEIIVDVPEDSADKVWSISGLKNKQGLAFVTLVGVPNYLSLLPEQLLIPKELSR
jgi:hypothetical protein